jgi:hypothetical protein
LKSGELLAQLLQFGAELVVLASAASKLFLKVGQPVGKVPDSDG